MEKRSFFSSLSAVLISFWLCTTVTYASGLEFKKAVDVYLKNDFAAALPMFQALDKSEPNNENIHYYLALCYQRVGENDKAAADYNWILKNSKNEAFKEIIKARIKKVTHFDGNSGPVAQSTETFSHDPVRKVIFFSTNWCSVCRAFTPTWDQTVAKLKGKIEFQHLNAEDPANKALVDKYRPKAYPTLVYLDAKNNVIENRPQAPMGEAFSKRLSNLGAGK